MKHLVNENTAFYQSFSEDGNLLTRSEKQSLADRGLLVFPTLLWPTDPRTPEQTHTALFTQRSLIGSVLAKVANSMINVGQSIIYGDQIYPVKDHVTKMITLVSKAILTLKSGDHYCPVCNRNVESLHILSHYTTIMQRMLLFDSYIKSDSKVTFMPSPAPSQPLKRIYLNFTTNDSLLNLDGLHGMERFDGKLIATYCDIFETFASNMKWIAAERRIPRTIVLQLEDPEILTDEEDDEGYRSEMGSTAAEKVTVEPEDTQEVKTGEIQYTTGEEMTMTKSSYELGADDMQAHWASALAIKEFLERPVALQAVTYNTSTGLGSDILVDYLPARLFNKAQIREKLTGVMGMRGDVKITLKWAADPFMQGALMLTYIPLATSRLASIEPLGLNTVDRPFFNGSYPHKIVDISQGDTVEIVIPFVDPKDFYMPTDGPQHCSKFFITAITPLRSVSGSSSLTINAFYNFENVTLYGRTLTSNSDWNNFLTIEPTPPPLSSRDVEYESQMLRANPVGRGVVANPIAAGAAAGAGYALGSQAGQASREFMNTVTENLSDTARQFLSETHAYCRRTGRDIWKYISDLTGSDEPEKKGGKPAEKKKNTRSIRSTPMSGINQPGFTPARSFATTADREITTNLNGITSNEFIECAKIPSYFQKVVIDSSAAVGERPMAFQISPDSFSNTVTFDTGQYAKQPSHLCFVGGMYGQWSGGIELQLEAICTHLHSGKFLIAFQPHTKLETDPLDPIPTIEEAMRYMHHIIWDIRESKKCNFTIPYVAGTPTLATRMVTGTVHFILLNGIRHPATVSQYVDVLVSVRGAPDIQFYEPIGQPYACVSTTTNLPFTLSHEAIPPDVDENYRAEMSMPLARAGIKSTAHIGDFGNEQFGLIHKMTYADETVFTSSD
jgi:hypothetical protein